MKHLTQHKINIFNFVIAALALLLSVPASINQINQYFQDRAQNAKTTVVYFSPPDIDGKKALVGENCWGSLASLRSDAYRCSESSLLHDPCFWIEDHADTKNSYFYCPASWQTSSKDSLLAVPNEKVERRHWDSRKEAENENALPWLITLEDGTSCQLHTGSVELAYGNKGSIFGCSSSKYASVTDGVLESGKQYFECKLAKETVFKKCFARLVVF